MALLPIDRRSRSALLFREGGSANRVRETRTSVSIARYRSDTRVADGACTLRSLSFPFVSAQHWIERELSCVGARALPSLGFGVGPACLGCTWKLYYTDTKPL